MLCLRPSPPASDFGAWDTWACGAGGRAQMVPGDSVLNNSIKPCSVSPPSKPPPATSARAKTNKPPSSTTSSINTPGSGRWMAITPCSPTRHRHWPFGCCSMPHRSSNLLGVQSCSDPPPHPIATHATAATFSDPGSGDVSSVAFSPDGTTIAVTYRNRYAYLWGVSPPLPGTLAMPC